MSTDKQLVELIDNATTALKAVVDHVMNQDASGDNANGRDVLTEAQIAERLQLSLSSIRKERKKGRYPFFFREGGRWVTTGALYAKWLETRGKRAGVAVGVKRA